MKQLVKQSKKNITKMRLVLPILILFVIFTIVMNPSKYSQVALGGLEVWVKVLVPSLFPFFVLTKLFASSGFVDDFTKVLKTPTKKIYNCPPCSSYIFLMSIITGYPVGAKLVADFYNNGMLSKNDAVKTLSFSANSGPMFILGSVAIGMFANQKLGLIMYFSHILGALLNGLLYRNYTHGTSLFKFGKRKMEALTLASFNSDNNKEFTKTQQIVTKANNSTEQNNIDFSASINSSIASIMLIGGVICFTFVLIELITSSFLFKGIINLLSTLGLNSNLICAITSGIFEITKGCLMLSSLPLSVNAIAILCTFIISFGGISTLLQAIAFTKNIVPTKTFILQKITHAFCATIVCGILLLTFV